MGESDADIMFVKAEAERYREFVCDGECKCPDHDSWKWCREAKGLAEQYERIARTLELFQAMQRLQSARDSIPARISEDT